MLALDIILSQNDSNTQLDLLDYTGGYSAGNLGGWGTPNASVTDVISVTIGGTFRPAPSNTPALTIAPVTLMPSGQYPLPYYIWQEFALTPSLLALPSNNFNDGVYELTYTVNTTTVSVTFTGATGNFALGDIIRDTTQAGIQVGVMTAITQAAGSGTMVLTSTLGTTIAHLDVLTNGTVTANANVATYTNNTYTAPIQPEVTPNADCCIGNKLSKIDPFCDCGCDETEDLFDKFMILMGSKAMCACTQNNSGLDALGYVQDYCAGCGCGCS